MSTPEFDTVEEAKEWMIESIDDNCIDNIRFAFTDDREAMQRYGQQEDNGCCGFFEADVIVDGKSAIIGCNYGH